MHPSSFREALFETPGICPLATLPSQPVSPATTAHFAKGLAWAYSDRVISKAICELETCPVNPTPYRAAHHEAMKQQERSKDQEGKPPARPTQTRAPGNLSIPTDLPGRAIPKQRPTYRSQRPDPCVTEEALVSTVLLNNPMLDDIEDLGYPIFHMGTESSNPPDPPWFPRPDAPLMPRLVSSDENGQPIDLPYL